MTFKALARFIIGAGLLLVPHAAGAHHGAAGYDNTKMTVLAATITEFIWKNPHSEVRFDAAGENGEVKHWAIEAPPPTMLVERGWNKAALKPGDKVTLHFNAARNGATAGILRKVVLPSGEDLWAYPPPELVEKLTTAPR
jgi:hypothetical protein